VGGGAAVSVVVGREEARWEENLCGRILAPFASLSFSLSDL
jgi:hypothetical protein